MNFSKKWKKSWHETGFVPRTFGFKDHCLIHYSTGPMMKPGKKVLKSKILDYLLLIDKKAHARVN
jgi:hypothetical protein